MATTLKDAIYQKLYKQRDGFVSGQEISEEFNCSRTAIWKYIEELRTEGFEIESLRKSGYKLLSEPDSLSNYRVSSRLNTKNIGSEILYEQIVSSTQTLASTLASNGAKEGTIVIAEEQTAGKGRLSRQWSSEKGKGIWMSIILRPSLPIHRTPQLTLLTAVAAASTITDVIGVQGDIKWPNDILINGKKVVGILTELQAEADCVNSVIIGIGINVNHENEDFSIELQETATSLRIEKNKEINRIDFLVSFLTRFEELYEQYLQVGFYPIKLLWEAYSISIGRQIHARMINGTITGEALGINDEGVLLLRDEEGVIHSIYSADIQFA